MHWHHWLGTVIGIACLLNTGALGPQIAWGQKATHPQDHQHSSPHGGQVVEASKHHLELVVKDHTMIQVYLYDEQMRPVALPTPEATLYLRLPGNTNHTLTLTATGSGAEAAWTTRTDALQHVSTFEAALRVTLAGETRNIRFMYKGAYGSAPHQH